MQQSNPQRVPLGFVDINGYVTPYNGRIVDNLPGRYIYTQREMDFYLEEQRRMESEREAQRYGSDTAQADDVSTPPVAPTAPIPPVPPMAQAVPTPPPLPPSHINLTEEQKEALPPGINANNAAVAAVFSTK